ncbi:hypothetical protein LKD81_16780 [Lachnospiraceae bacterium CLA-AA-H215]|uniref:Uncharacterized protein n=1 Tax=Hominifimenecus microfluidus TaxID=2885348 RepID=A0AAE3EDD6_9FIRM|nr:hypothetical protein [Hominifimenecus microfluidus]MCC2232624.1 hypothetical protein [Hominifimenecus microfluidus]
MAQRNIFEPELMEIMRQREWNYEREQEWKEKTMNEMRRLKMILLANSMILLAIVVLTAIGQR